MTDPATATAKAVEATAKAADKALTIVHDTGGYLREVVGDLPKNAVGVLGADWLGQKRMRNLDAMMRRTEAILRERDAQPVDQLSPNIATELLTGAQEESRDELIELWARLLANALDPKLNSVRHSFIEAVKQMDVADTLVLQLLHSRGCVSIALGKGAAGPRLGVSDVAEALSRSEDDVEVSLDHLVSIGMLGKPQGSAMWLFAATAREFMRACCPEYDEARS